MEINQSKVTQVVTRTYEHSVFAEAIARICKQINISIARNRLAEK